MAAEDSILKTTKKALGLADDYTVFDAEIIMFINTVFADLHQIGVGTSTTFQIEDDSTLWSEFLTGTSNMQNVQTYMFLRVKLLFDIPSTSFVIDAIQKQIDKLEWRLNFEREVAIEGLTDTSSDSVQLWDISETGDFPTDAQDGDLGIDTTTGDIWENVV